MPPVMLKNTEYGHHPSVPRELTNADNAFSGQKAPAAKTFPAKIAAPKPESPATPIPTGLVKPVPPFTVLNPKAESPGDTNPPVQWPRS